QFDVAIGMPYADIAGVEPTAVEGGVGCLWILKVALHHVIAMHHDLTHGLSIAGHIVHLLIDDAHPISGHIALALPGEQVSLFLGGKFVPLLVPFANGIGAIGLGQSIDMNRT